MIDLPVYDSEHWQNRAQCYREGIDPDRMAPEVASQVELNEAKQVCFRCEVRRECLSAARAQDAPYGIWGGAWFGDRPRQPAEAACEWCGKGVENAEGGRTRRYCGGACQKAARRARLAVAV